MFFFSKKQITPLIHAIIWLCLFFYPFLFHYIPFDDGMAVLRIGLFLLLLISFFYTNTLVFIPKVLGKKRVLLYLTSIISSILLIAFLAGYIQVIFNPDYSKKPEAYSRAFNTGIVTGLLTLIISSSIKVTTEWFRNQQLMRAAESEKLNAELNFLKSQVNPHFLFNALNNIYALENKKSPDTGPAILKLSELIRYMFYETGAEFVPLEKEIEYLQNYIELQKLGLSKDVVVSFRLEGDASHKRIKPMLLISLVENVFKHGISYLNHAPMTIRLQISDHQLELSTSNKITDQKLELRQRTGTGLSSLKKRLELLYPGKHELSVSNDKGIYTASLKIPIQ